INSKSQLEKRHNANYVLFNKGEAMFRCFLKFLITTLVLFVLVSCGESSDKNVVDVVAKDFRFEVTDSITSGWTSFRLKNMGHSDHFFLLSLLPDSITFEDYLNEVSRPFDIVFDSLKAGSSKEDAINLLVQLVPSWYFTSVKQMGGTGIIDAGKTAQITMNLVPGTYVMECYIKEQGVFHTALGMINPVTVTNEISDMQPPEANVDIFLTNDAITAEGEIESGFNTFAVHFKEHPEAGLGNDVHLVKINSATDLNEVLTWMDWTNIKGLEPPAPAEFLGGSQEMPVGYTSYFTVNLKPGNYALVNEAAMREGNVLELSVN
ncbi:MAG: hypothetical protein P8X47_13425, partial [Ignavibacteriaceae bacterium]